jgi:hypothetical protein
VKPWIRIRYTHPGDARGWIGLGCWVLVIVIFAMILFDRSLLDSDAFLILATAIVITGWVQGPVGWAYQATKQGGEMAESSARIAEEAATAAVGGARTAPKSAQEAADRTADAAVDEAGRIKGNS